jgi:hypothetical protein
MAWPAGRAGLQRFAHLMIVCISENIGCLFIILALVSYTNDADILVYFNRNLFRQSLRLPMVGYRIRPHLGVM